MAGSSGLFFLRGFYIFDAPQWPFRILGSSIPELGSAIQGSSVLNPLFASVLIPFLLVALFLGHPSWKWFCYWFSPRCGSLFRDQRGSVTSCLGFGAWRNCPLVLGCQRLIMLWTCSVSV